MALVIQDAIQGTTPSSASFERYGIPACCEETDELYQRRAQGKQVIETDV